MKNKIGMLAALNESNLFNCQKQTTWALWLIYNSGLQLAREFKGADRKELESTKATTPGDN